MRALVFVSFLLLATATAHAETLEVGGEGSSVSKQLVSIQAGPFTPQSISISNGSYVFDYSKDSLKSAWFEAGVGAHLFDFLGSVYIEENLAFTNFRGVAQDNLPNAAGQDLSVMMVGFDTRLMHSWNWFPLKWVVPFIDGGYQYTLFYQSGPSDLESVQGGIGNAVAGGGLQLWLNRGSSHEEGRVNMFSTFPIFLTAKVNHIFPRSGGLDLASTSFLGGLTFGL